MSGIAIYEEDDLMRALLKEWLSEAGHRVCEAAPCGVRRGGSEDLEPFLIGFVLLYVAIAVQLSEIVRTNHE